MSKYFYRAVKDKKELVTGYIEAQNQEEAKNKVKTLGFTPAGIYEEDFIPKKYKQKANIAINKIGLKDLILFTSQMQMFMSSGISVLEALDSISQHAPSKKISVFSKDLADKIKSGKTLSEAVYDYSDVTGKVYTALIRAGEDSGSLPETLQYLTNLLKKQDNLKGKIIQMSIYPAILIIIMTVMYFAFGGFLFPKIISAYNLDISEIPKTALFFTTTVSFIFKTWFIWLISAICGWLFLAKAVGIKNVKKAIASFCMKVPLLKECVRYVSLTHYMSVLNVAYESGIMINSALKLAEDTITNPVLSKRAKFVISAVEKGTELTQAFYNSELLPPVMLSLISTGEKTGKLGQMFKDIATEAEKKLDMAITTLSKAFEPAVLITIGLGVAVVATAVIQMYLKSLTSVF